MLLSSCGFSETALPDTKLRNAAMDKFIEMLRNSSHISKDQFLELISPEMTHYIWSATTTDRALRRVVLSAYDYTVHPDQIRPHMEKLHFDFIKELMLGALQSSVLRVSPTNEEGCAYHEHDEKHPKCTV